jgi:hypothetical protein
MTTAAARNNDAPPPAPSLIGTVRAAAKRGVLAARTLTRFSSRPQQQGVPPVPDLFAEIRAARGEQR